MDSSLQDGLPQELFPGIFSRPLPSWAAVLIHTDYILKNRKREYMNDYLASVYFYI